MNTSAVVMMIFSMLLLWGGLVAAMLNLRRHDRRQDRPPVST